MENAAHADRPVGRPREAAGLAAFENNVFRRGPVNADDYEMVTGKKGTTSFGEIRDAQIVQETVCAKFGEQNSVREYAWGKRLRVARLLQEGNFLSGQSKMGNAHQLVSRP